MPIVNRKAPNKTHTQAALFGKDVYTKAGARKWCKDHNLFTDGYEETEQFHRFRQYDPQPNKFRYRNQRIAEGITFVQGFTKTSRADLNEPMSLLPQASWWNIEAMGIQNLVNALRIMPPSALAELEGVPPSPLQTLGDVAVVSMTGPMEKRPSVFGTMLGASSNTMIKQAVRQAAGDPDVRTILLRIDSPGGTVDGLRELSDEIYKARQSKPVIAAVDGMCASASFHAGSQATKIFAGPMDLIGSIGTKLTLLDCSELYAKAGVKPITIAEPGELKATGEPGQPVTDAQREYMTDIVRNYYADFVKAIARGRDMTPAAVREAADQGQVFMAKDALASGLIDGIADFDKVLDVTLKRSGQKRQMAMNQLKLSRAQMN